MACQAKTLSSNEPRATAAANRPWAKWLLPSFPDLMFVSLVWWLFAGGPFGWVGLLSDGDTGWHIRTGEYILDSGRVPYVDLFSFSKPGAPWFAWEWLSDVVFAGLYRFGGLKALVLFCGALICLAITLVFLRMLSRGVNLMVALVLGGLTAGAASLHYLARPHVFTLVFLGASLWLLELDRRKESRWVWLLIPVTAVWTNLHGGFLSLIACLGLQVLGTALETLLAGSRNWGRLRRHILLAVGCSAATLLNPYGYQLHIHVSKYLSSDWIRKTIGEFQSPSFRSESMIQFEFLLLAGLVVCGYLLRRRQIVESLWILFWAHMSLSSARHIPIFIIVATPLIAVELNSLWERWTERADRKSVLGILRQVASDLTAGQCRFTLLPVIVLILIALFGPAGRFPTDFPAVKFPVAMVDRYQEQLRNSRVLTVDQWADYLIYRSYPNQKVYVDGRSDFYGPEVGNEYLALMTARFDWEQIIEKRQFSSVLIPPEWPLSALLKISPRWETVRDDGTSILFLRRQLAAIEVPGR